MSGATVGDTARAQLVSPLVVELRTAAGTPAPLGTVVRFEGAVVNGGWNAQVAAAGSSTFDLFAAAATDGAGRAAAFVRLGFRAGPARVTISVPTLGITESASYSVMPGNAVRLEVMPRDTAVYEGNSAALRPAVLDAYGNPIVAAVTWTSSGAGAPVSVSGAVTGGSLGRYLIDARSGAFRDSVFVSVVPRGVIVGILETTGAEVVAMNLDGSGRRVVAQTGSGGVELRPRWLGTNGRVLYTDSRGTALQPRIAEVDGTTRALLSPTAMLGHAYEPVATAAGDWIWFAASDSLCRLPNNFCLHRARPDGSALEVFDASVTPASETASQPSPSRDGARVAFVSREGGIPRVRVLVVAQRRVESWRVNGHNPEFSPSEDLIAFRLPAGGIGVVRPDGTGLRTVRASDVIQADPITWSPDGQWILALDEGTLEAFHVETGRAITLPFHGYFRSPHWR